MTLADRLFLLAQRLSGPVTLLLLLVPVLMGLCWIILPAFGYLPAIGVAGFGLDAFRAMLDAPGFGKAVWLSLFTGLTATLISLVMASLAVAILQTRPGFGWLERQLSPLLSVPHVTIAIGVAFLIAPSGWIMRLLSPEVTGFQRPPDWLIVQDPAGLAQILVLVLKEMPFLVLMMLAAVTQLPWRERLTLSESLGYHPLVAWYKLVWPGLYPRIRLAIFITLAFSMSVVDIALIVGPTTPPVLSVLILQWFTDSDLMLRLQAAAGAVTITLLAFALIGGWIAGEKLLAGPARRWRANGGRGALFQRLATATGLSGGAAVLALAWGGLAGLAVWSVARQWRFPDALPGVFSLHSWQRVPDRVSEPMLNTVMIALAAVLISVLLCMLMMERERALYGRVRQRTGLWLLVPLLLPQIGFLFGFQIVLAWMDLAGTWTALIWVHVIFVLPYTWLSMVDSWARFDSRYEQVAVNLGAGPWRVFRQIKLPLLLKPVLTAMAVGIAVSVAAYLPTLVAGVGRIDSLTTEVVSLATSGNRRLAGVYGMLQMVIPLIAFALVPVITRLRPGNR